MGGWLVFLLLGAAAMAGLFWGARLRGAALLPPLAALFVAAAGYAVEGRPDLPGAPHQDRASRGLAPDTLFMVEHQRLLKVYGEPAQWAVFADGLTRAGEDGAAVSVLARAVEKYPANAALRVAYAHSLLVLADGHMTPAVLLAFERARAVAGSDPSAAYFEGLAWFESGDPLAAEQSWRALSAALPPASPWRLVLAERLHVFDLLRAGRLPAAPPDAAGGAGPG
ncbi:tetratricopeptide repeat protein [Sphingomonas morindae]|uniref:Cytochrome C biogenesis protein n=1 Tax=Sphingomonas morindae TaxID=1541170 RepID=A0ABY4X6H7_9SPHN|nr:hypothetical protein [Sphingomonas morindae]USI72486.1 hypothetical protein LHA26_14500 [Sphingomonas morindae]